MQTSVWRLVEIMNDIIRLNYEEEGDMLDTLLDVLTDWHSYE
jgi:hypothetical protein